MAHGSYDDWWKARNLRPHLKGVKTAAVMTVGGWFDAENLFGALECYRNIEANSPGISNTFVMGPWYHGQWGGRANPGEGLGYVKFDAKTSDFYRESIEFPFFEHVSANQGIHFCRRANEFGESLFPSLRIAL